jgi:hypothetical protein
MSKHQKPTSAQLAEEPGACWITEKQTGQARCHMLTQAECQAQGGQFIGGPCGFGELFKPEE